MSTIVEAWGLARFYTRYAEIYKKGVGELKKKEKRKPKEESKAERRERSWDDGKKVFPRGH
jgi:hypothetical protein